MNLPGFTAEESLVRSARIYSQRYSFSGFAPGQSATTIMSARLSPAYALGNFWFKGGAGSRRVVREIDGLVAPGTGACYCAECLSGPSCATYLSPSCDPAFLDWWCGHWIGIQCPDGKHPCLHTASHLVMPQLRCCDNMPVAPKTLTHR
jgi:hypothetical protein